MTDDEARALGRRWIKANGGWRPGMLSGGPVRLRGLASYATGYRFDAIPHPDLIDTSRAWPDLRDPATRGAALDVVRERYNDPTIYIEIGFTGPDTPPNAWLRSGAGHDAPYANESTEAEALVSALESKERP